MRILFALADREPIQSPGWHKQSLALESGWLGWAWGWPLEASFGLGGGEALTLFWPMRMTDFTVPSCSINQKATSSWWNEAWWAGVWCHPATGGWRLGGLWSLLALGEAILWRSAARVGARLCTQETYWLYLLPGLDTHSNPAQRFNYAAIRKLSFYTRRGCPDLFIFPRVGTTTLS